MLGFLKKNKLLYDTVVAVLLATASLSHWFDFSDQGKQMNLLGGIIFGILCLIKFTDVLDELRKVRERHKIYICQIL